MRFRITTDEAVQGMYAVEADTPEEAAKQFGDPKINWDRVEQIDYMAYACRVKTVEPERLEAGND